MLGTLKHANTVKKGLSGVMQVTVKNGMVMVASWRRWDLSKEEEARDVTWRYAEGGSSAGPRYHGSVPDIPKISKGALVVGAYWMRGRRVRKKARLATSAKSDWMLLWATTITCNWGKWGASVWSRTEGWQDLHHLLSFEQTAVQQQKWLLSSFKPQKACNGEVTVEVMRRLGLCIYLESLGFRSSDGLDEMYQKEETWVHFQTWPEQPRQGSYDWGKLCWGVIEEIYCSTLPPSLTLLFLLPSLSSFHPSLFRPLSFPSFFPSMHTYKYQQST